MILTFTVDLDEPLVLVKLHVLGVFPVRRWCDRATRGMSFNLDQSQRFPESRKRKPRGTKKKESLCFINNHKYASCDFDKFRVDAHLCKAA